MTSLLLGLAVIAAGGAAASLLRRPALGAAAAVAGALLGLAAPLRVLAGGVPLALTLPWAVPYGSFHVGLDALSAFFLVPILLLAALCALHGLGSGDGSRGAGWLFYGLLAASMALVVVARNGLLFLAGWEVMSVSSFFLVVGDGGSEPAREAGWSLLVAGQLGAAALLLLFVWLGRGRGLDFEALAAPTPRAAGVLFLLAVVGFGAKAGFAPLHVWLPEAHPAAPSHVSALMSGVMIKTGVYGLLRVLLLLGPGPAWWGWLLVGVGAGSGAWGALLALAQRDLKRALAYSSVENVGVIAMGLGLGLLGRAAGDPVLAALGFGGALLHVLNHALFKSLLFLGAGSATHAAGTRDLERLGGLAKRMPATASFFAAGSAAIAGLPPFNGFLSELLVMLAAFRGVLAPSAAVAAPAAVAVAALALTAALAAACFTRAFGIAFLGQARDEAARSAHEAGALELAPMAVLAAACLAVGLGAPWLAALAGGGWSFPLVAALGPAASGSAVLLALALALACLRAWLLDGRPVRAGETWGCGYDRPTSSMQYTAASLAEPLTALGAAALGTRRRGAPVTGYFPGRAELDEETPDPARARLFEPLFRGVERQLGRLRWLQHGNLQLYVLNIAAALLVLLLWKLG